MSVCLYGCVPSVHLYACMSICLCAYMLISRCLFPQALSTDVFGYWATGTGSFWTIIWLGSEKAVRIKNPYEIILVEESLHCTVVTSTRAAHAMWWKDLYQYLSRPLFFLIRFPINPWHPHSPQPHRQRANPSASKLFLFFSCLQAGQGSPDFFPGPEVAMQAQTASESLRVSAQSVSIRKS